MSDAYTRRDFLKLAGLLSLNAVAPSLTRGMQQLPQTQTDKKNVIVIVFDAFSAFHLSLYGYGRETTPTIARLAERAVVYHNHFAGGCFTTPGTASLLTGAHPWKHRAFKYYNSVNEDFAHKTIFNIYDDYYRLAYSHNPLVTTVLDKFAPGIDNYIPLEQYFLTSENLLHSLFSGDNDTATISWSRAMKKEEGYSYSLVLSDLYKQYQNNKVKQYFPQFPIGMPAVLVDNYFLLEDAVDAIGSLLADSPRPFAGYFHLMPPHQPYSPSLDFYNTFKNDNLPWINKPEDMFSQNKKLQFLQRRCQQYDEFILYVDREFGRFMDHLEASGLLDDTWVVLTSDHGELFERGILGHTSEVLYQPVVRIPLVIFEPGRKTRTDIHTKTSAVDVLPTLAHVTGRQMPEWSEGIVLPPFSADAPDPEHCLYVMQAKDTEPESPISMGTLALVKGQYKITYFFNYPKLEGQERVELYDIDQDPHELNNLYPGEKTIGNQLLNELKSKLDEMNKPYI
jgi:arylsulfatase A-like enzyme